MSKQYGLIIPGKTDAKRSAPIFSSKRNVFGGDSESDEERSSKPKASLRTNEKTKRQAKIAQEKALEEDPTVFQYDELYDDMTAKKVEAKEAVRAEKKPKYIEKLLESAVRRKKENERRVEREVQKERELEGDKFSDKESFVTSAYKKKLQEMAEEEEKEKREAYLEAIGEVTKQKDLGGFYRHLYEQKLRPDISSMGKDDKRIKTETPSEDKEQTTLKNCIKMESPEAEDTETVDSTPEVRKDERKRKFNSPERSSFNKKPRSYRQRTEIDADVSDGEIQSDDEINRVNLEDLKSAKRAKTQDINIDADSDFATDSSDDDTDVESKDNKSEKKNISEKLEGGEVEFKTPKLPDEKSDGKEKFNEKEEVKEEITEPKIDIWKKRTVGIVFDEALKRYFERKAARGQ